MVRQRTIVRPRDFLRSVERYPEQFNLTKRSFVLAVDGCLLCLGFGIDGLRLGWSQYRRGHESSPSA